MRVKVEVELRNRLYQDAKKCIYILNWIGQTYSMTKKKAKFRWPCENYTVLTPDYFVVSSVIS